MFFFWNLLGWLGKYKKRDYGRDIKKESWWKEGYNLLVFFCDLIEKRIVIYVYL